MRSVCIPAGMPDVDPRKRPRHPQAASRRRCEPPHSIAATFMRRCSPINMDLIRRSARYEIHRAYAIANVYGNSKREPCNVGDDLPRPCSYKRTTSPPTADRHTSILLMFPDRETRRPGALPPYPARIVLVRQDYRASCARRIYERFPRHPEPSTPPPPTPKPANAPPGPPPI